MSRYPAAGAGLFGAFRLWLAAAVIVVSPAAPAHAAPPDAGPDIKSDIALILDHETGTTLYEKNADKPFQPSSLVKLMTLLVAADLMQQGKLSLDQELRVSEYAWRTGGAPSHTATMFAPINATVKVSDLYQGMMVQNANDSAIILAEGISGTELAFSELMTKKGEDLGLTKSVFRNPSGLPDPAQQSTARDMARIAGALIGKYPDTYKGFAQSDFTFNKIRQTNRNPLINAGIGADGLLTGFAKDAGYHIVGSAVQGRQRLIIVVAGAKGEKERLEEARKGLDWAFRTFETVTYFSEGETIARVSVYGGEVSSVGVKADRPITLLLPKGSRGKVSARVQYRGPLKAPVEAGRSVGTLVILRDDKPVQETALITAEAVGMGSLPQRAADAATEYGLGKVRRWLGWK